MQRALLPILIAVMGATLMLLSVLAERVSASPLLPESLPRIEATYVLPSPLSTHECHAVLESLIAQHPDAFVPGVRLVPSRATLPAIASRDGGLLTLTLDAWPVTPITQLTVLRAQISDAEGVLTNLALPVYFDLEAPGLIAARDLARDTPLAAADVQLSWVSLRGRSSAPIADPAALAGLGLTQAVLAGRVIEARMLKSPTLVQRGALVRVRVRKGGLSLETTLKALEAGVAGTVIRLENSLTKQILLARVTGPNAAVID